MTLLTERYIIVQNGIRRGGDYVTEVLIGGKENFESALKRFNKKVQDAGILAEYRRREFFEKPSIRRKKKEAAKLRKTLKSSR